MKTESLNPRECKTYDGYPAPSVFLEEKMMVGKKLRKLIMNDMEVATGIMLPEKNAISGKRATKFSAGPTDPND